MTEAEQSRQDMRANLAEFEARRDEAQTYATAERGEFLSQPLHTRRTRQEWAASAAYWTGRVAEQRALISTTT